MKKKKPLPILEHVSYSSLTDNKDCGWYFKLKHLLKLEVDTDSIWTHYGKWVHHFVQAVLCDQLEPEKAAKMFIRRWFKFCGIYRKPLATQYKDGDPKVLYKGPVRAIMSIKEIFKKEFGDYKVLQVEERLKELTKYPQKFKGFIDIVIADGDGVVWIIDFKTCRNHFFFKKYKDKYKDYQLTLYKHFWAIKHNVDPKDIKTAFVTIARDPSVKKPVEVIPITSGKKKIANALKWMNGILSSIQREMFVKNRMTCRSMYGKECPFLNTEHCK